MSKGGASIPDEEWERFLKEAEAGSPGAPEEPSARARMVTRRIQEEPGRPEGWRTYTPARRRSGRKWYALGLVVAVVLLVAVAVAPGRIFGWFDGADASDSRPLAAEPERPSGPPAEEAAGRQPTPESPFDGSPAARWSDGTAGIQLPEARATGWMSKAEVARALDSTRDFLAASSLDPAVLRGERPSRAMALINPHQSDVQDFLKKAFRSPDRENDPLLLFSRFRSADVRPVGDVVKTRGRITFREGVKGAVEVATDVTYVYPVVRASGDGDEVARTIVRREVVLSWDDPAKIVIEPGTFSLVSYKVDTTNGGCDTYTGYLTPAFLAERTTSDGGDGPAVDPYDRSTSMEERMRGSDDEGCGTASRS
ncbi:hypothetical protein [Streptomyces sp. SID14515]|uniref:hypothetical protein n=1 Tax=Streptomyces sp. SID14515 TaxID=2706074 RepID=UPI0013C7F43C|nr:hypothetical protein [Streptomyces sp. SID14515]NEB36215.1 hypothetical protein [Streptomyces sp. SID14515]